MKHFFGVILLAFALTGCGTVSGVGQDLQKLGEAIDKSTKK